MNHTSDERSSPKRRHPAETLGPRELTRFGEFVYAIIPLLCTQPVPLPPAVRASTALRALFAEASPDMVRIGACMRDLYVQEEDLPGVSLEQGTLLWDAIREAITILDSGQWMRAYGQQQGWYGEEETREVPAIPLSAIAQGIIDGAFSDGYSRPPQQVRWPRVRFALALDAQCSDAYLISGMLHEEAGLYLLAHCAYETSMRLAAERFGGEDALVKRFARNRNESLWSETGGRQYLCSRAALARMLWKWGAYKNAKAQYEAMLKLNPGDNQGNRDDLLCLLLEAGEAKALERALNTFRRHTFADGHTEVVAGTIWHYTNACWCYQRWRNAQNTPERETAKREAERALHEAFTQNRFVPTLLLASEGLPELDELSAYSKGDGTEAAMYVNLALVKK